MITWPRPRALAPSTSTRSAPTLRRASTRFDVTGALEVVWDAVRARNLVPAEAPSQLAKDKADADELDAVLYTLVDGLARLAVALRRNLPETSPKISPRSASPKSRRGSAWRNDERGWG